MYHVFVAKVIWRTGKDQPQDIPDGLHGCGNEIRRVSLRWASIAPRGIGGGPLPSSI